MSVALGIAYLIGWLVLDQPLRFDSLVPAAFSAGLVITVFLATDALLVVLLGATFGELLAGVRVTTLEESRLGYSQRQDRTQAGLLEGSIGCIPLLAAFWRREPAPYDRDCIFHFQRLTPLAILARGLVVSALLLALVVVGVAVGLKGFESNAPVVLTQAMRLAGVNVRERWRNPMTGVNVVLPKGWFLDNTYHRNYGDLQVDFRCAHGEPCLVRLALSPGFEWSHLDPNKETALEGLQRTFKRILSVDIDLSTVDSHDQASEEERLDKLYSSRLVVEREDASKPIAATAIVWFTDRRDTWGIALMAPGGAESAVATEATELAFNLIGTTVPRP